MKLFLILILTVTGVCFAETDSEQLPESRKSDYKMDWKYRAGEFLIFDCERGHYACVNKEGNENCLEERNFMATKEKKIYPCAPLKKYADKKTCIENSYRVVDLNAARRFCFPK